jgi:hypothetical protein
MTNSAQKITRKIRSDQLKFYLSEQNIHEFLSLKIKEIFTILLK